MENPPLGLYANPKARTFQFRLRQHIPHLLVPKRLAAQDKAKYFAGWVERFLQTADAEAAGLALEAVSAFLDQLSRQGELWKLQQTREARWLYRCFEASGANVPGALLEAISAAALAADLSRFSPEGFAPWRLCESFTLPCISGRTRSCNPPNERARLCPAEAARQSRNAPRAASSP